MLTHVPHLPHLCQGKAVGRRSELNAGTLASLLQWAEVESEDLEKLIKTAFRQVSRGGRLNREDLPKALRHCRFKDVREQWVEEIYEGITMVPFVEAEDFEKFVNEYAEKQQEAYAEAFRKFDVDESDQISTQELQEVLRSLGFVVQPSLVSEIMEKVDYDGSGELSFDEFETLMKLLEDSDGFPQMEQDELKLSSGVSTVQVVEALMFRASQVFLLGSDTPLTSRTFKKSLTVQTVKTRWTTTGLFWQ